MWGMKKMKLVNMVVGFSIGLASLPVFGDTCVKTSFNVTYGCGDGTVKGTLPAATTAQYGSSFSPTAISTSMCTPPSGYVYAGQAVRIDGQEVAWHASTGAKSFTYYYTSDIEITPHFAPIASADTLAANLGTGGRNYTYVSGAKGTWTTEFYYGAVSGVSQCSTVKPENTAGGWNMGLIASDQDAIENSTSGQYCYCKMTAPDIAASPWVFANDRGPASYCASDCADHCGSRVYAYAVFRASVFAAAGD